MELVLIRHGEPEWVVGGRNRNDPVLTARGRSQAERVAARIADPTQDPVDGPVDHLLVSPARRAQETAAPIADALGIQAVTHDWLLELQMPPHWEDSPIEVRPGGLRRPAGLAPRAVVGGHGGRRRRCATSTIASPGARIGALGALGVAPTEERGLWQLADDAPERVVAVAHGGTNSTLVAHLLGVEKEPWDWERFKLGHASVAVLRTSPLAGASIWSLCGLGDAAHLPRHERTT